MTATLTLSAFGQAVASTGSSTSAYGFGATSGYRTEGDVGLTLVGCRFYDAQVGRFISRDTYLNQKPYAYCDGDPVNALDPSGHMLTGIKLFLVAYTAIARALLDFKDPEPIRPPPVITAPPPQTSSGPAPPPSGEGEPEGGGNIGGVITTVGTGIIVGGTGVVEALQWKRGIQAYEGDPGDPGKDPPPGTKGW